MNEMQYVEKLKDTAYKSYTSQEHLSSLYNIKEKTKLFLVVVVYFTNLLK